MVIGKWTHNVNAIPASGLSARRVANDEERAALAAELDILGCDQLEADYTLRPSAGGHVLMTGTVKAKVRQACVVTLEPVAETIHEPLDTRFVPAAEAFRPQDDEQEALAAEDLEPITGDSVDAGRIVFEVVAAALTPFPRLADAALSDDGILEAGAVGRDNPFAALAALKRDEPKG